MDGPGTCSQYYFVGFYQNVGTMYNKNQYLQQISVSVLLDYFIGYDYELDPKQPVKMGDYVFTEFTINIKISSLVCPLDIHRTEKTYPRFV